MAENFFGITDTGRVRDNNEDAFIAKKVQNRFIIACAIDGVGGYTGGEIAAEIARESIFENFKELSGDLIAKMKSAFISANQQIFDEKFKTREHSKMACVLTLAVVDVENNEFHYAHVGDTRLYLLRDSSLVKVSKDHSFVGFLEDSGRIDEDAAMAHIKRNEINKALGFGREIETQSDYIETGTSPFLPGDTLLLCSDGLTDMVNKDSITSILTGNTDLEDKAKQLVALANKNGGKDNITVVLVQNDSASSWQALPVTATSHSPKPGSDIRAQQPPQTNMPKHSGKPTSMNTDPSPIQAKKKADQVGSKTGFNTLSVFLGLLSLALLATVVYLLTKDRDSEPSPVAESSQPAETRNTVEMQLQDALSSAVNDTLLLSDSIYRQPVILSDTLSILQDTLVVIASGNVIIKRDSSFSGPAIEIAENSRLVVLEGLKFQDFDVAISTHNDALYLRNVQFFNCRKPVQNFFLFPDRKFISGRLAGAGMFKSDSLNTPTR